MPGLPVISTPGLAEPKDSSISRISQCRPRNRGSGSCRGTSKNRGFRVSCGARYCANLTVNTTEFEIKFLKGLQEILSALVIQFNSNQLVCGLTARCTYTHFTRVCCSTSYELHCNNLKLRKDMTSPQFDKVWMDVHRPCKENTGYQSND